VTPNEITQVQPNTRLQLSLGMRFVRSVLVLLIAATVIWFVVFLPTEHSMSHFHTIWLGVGITIFCLWFCLVLLLIARYIWRLSGVAFTPIPGPAEIEAQLRAHLGRQPTLEEVAAMQQMIKTRRNEALLGLGAVFGGLYLGGHAFKGR
jgi:Na+/melibiose symporter-like transporter